MNKNKRSLNSYMKQLLIVVADLVLFFLANCSIVYFTNDGHVLDTPFNPVLFNYVHLLITSVLMLAINMGFLLYRSVWSFASIDEIVRNMLAAGLNTLMLFGVDRLLFEKALGYDATLPFYAYLLFYMVEFFMLCVPRLGIRAYKRFFKWAASGSSKNQERIMIVGAGFMGNFFINEINNNTKNSRAVVAVDDNPAKLNKRINGVRIKGTCADIPTLAKKYNIDTIIICIPSTSKARQKEVIELAMKTKCTVKISPSVDEFLEEGGKARKIRNIEIADLLARPEVTLDKKVCRYLIGQTVLVTGGGGSIGSEICMQVARYSPAKIIIFDIYENCAFELQHELNKKYGDTVDVYVRIGSVRDVDRLREVFEEFKPEVVFHAAAHKHVPLMEDSPCEAVKNNVFGTYNVAMICREFGVQKMVTLSTDKAVNPTNVMGCTKRITEIIIQYMDTISLNTVFTAVRFGNVLGSHGSVIPLFRRQIENGGPVTLTHPDIERYFMTIPEAAQLVCQAGGLAKGGEIFVLDMGQPVKIMDLAVNLIRLSGYEVDDIGIEITGLRPGEKMYEELAMDSELETRQTTELEKIFVNQPMEINPIKFKEMLKDLEAANDGNVRDILKKYVPNYNPSDNN